MHFRTPAPAILCGVAALSLLTGACATKKNVREAIAPVQNQVNDVAKKTTDNTTAIGDLDRNVARVDEKTMEADRKATAAGQAADRANQAATQAQQTAIGANTLAQQSMAKAGKIEDRIDNLDNYKLMTTEKVYFRINRADLSKEDRDKLDQAIQNLTNQKNYVIEIAGYTDKTGNKAANLELSRRRAEAVVRYLSIDHNVPLRKIHDVGAGPDFPDANNKTRADRKENRRVDIKVYALDDNGGQNTPTRALSSSSAQPAN
jgi:outer membrane protein OmpA-like peptidoglycan-associated protein